MTTTRNRYLVRRGERWHYYRRVPKKFGTLLHRPLLTLPAHMLLPLRYSTTQFRDISGHPASDTTMHPRSPALHSRGGGLVGRFGPPRIFNTDQGSQFTSFKWISTLSNAGIKISMDVKGRFMNNIFIERLWRSIKYEAVYLNAWEGNREAKTGIRKWIEFYNLKRPHSTHNGLTPD